MIGQTLGHYRILEKIGVGGMGVVYRARDERLQRDVALKVLPAGLLVDENARRRFRQEALALSQLNHPNIATVHDFDTQNEVDFLVMEYIPGATLAEKIAAGPLPARDTARMGIQMAEGLAAAQAAGVVHNDLNPRNMRVTPDGRLKILDFGLAQLLRPTAAAGSTTEEVHPKEEAAGTLPYMAPEQLRGEKSDGRTDIYAGGVVLYEMATGLRPFRQTQGSHLIAAILHQAPLPPSAIDKRVSPGLEAIILKALDKEPHRRYQSAKEMAVDLERLTIPVALVAPPRPRRWTRWAAAGAAMILLALAASRVSAVRDLLRPWLGPSLLPEQKILAVLPFQAIGGSGQSQAYADGLIETLSARLGQLSDVQSLQVIPAAEVRSRRVTSPDRSRRDLGANLALTGSLHQSGEMVRVNYALVDAATLRQLGADTITASAADPFALQDRVVAGVVRMLEVELGPPERQRLTSHGTKVASAYNYYLVGRGYLQSYDKAESIEMAIRVFEQAVQTDPTYARAWAGLGDAYWKKYEKTREAEWVEKARENCERAVVLDRDLSAARICLGTLADGAGEYEKAAGEFDRALRAEPTNDDAYRGLARAQQHLGKLEEAEKTFRQAIRLRPHYWAGYSWLGKFFADHGRFKEAVEQYQQAAALSPDNGQVYYSLGGVYIYLARYEDAIAALRKSIELRPSYAAYSNLGAIYTRLRRFESAIETLEQALKFPSRDHRIAGNLARAYYWAPGRRDKSAPMYERAIQLGLERLRINPKDADTQVMLANYHAMLGRKKEALDYLRQALKAQPKSHEFLAIAALVHNQLGDRAAAIAFLDKAVAAGYLPAEAGAAIELDSLRDHPKYQAIMRSK